MTPSPTKTAAEPKPKTGRQRLKLTAPQPQPESERASDRLIAKMREGDGATAAALAEAVGWQVHSVRGFIAGALKKRADLEVVAAKVEGVTRYRVVDRAGA